MCDFMLCLQLRDSLDAAFRGGIYEGADWVGDWGLAVVQCLCNERSPHPRNLIWQIAHDSIQSIMMSCPCEGMAEQILNRPDAFVRTTLMIAGWSERGREAKRPALLH